jgi:hypothetical protein
MEVTWDEVLRAMLSMGTLSLLRDLQLRRIFGLF